MSKALGRIHIPAFVKTDGFVMICLYAVTLLIHILMTLCTTIFNLTPDEYSVTAVAALANGLNWKPTVETGGYYGYFQSIFYIPVFWVTDDPYLRYRLMLVVNGILMSFVPVIVFYLSRNTFKVKKWTSLLFSVICGWYPSYMLLTKYTWNETMCSLLPWVFALLMYKSMGSVDTIKKQIFSVLGGLCLAAAYATHGRMLALVAAGAVLELVVFFSMKKKRVFCLTGFYISLAAGIIADKFIKKYLQSTLWRIDEGKTPTNTIERVLSKLFGDGSVANEELSISRFVNTLIGHLFYFLTSTWGFGAICVVAVISGIVLYYKRRSKHDSSVSKEKTDTAPEKIDENTAVFMWYTLFAMGAVFVVSVIFKATSTLYGERMDTVLYGRYTEMFYALAILAGLLMLYKGWFGLSQCFAALTVGAGINVLTEIFAVPDMLECDRMVSAMIMDISPLRYGESLKDMYTHETFLKMIFTTMLLLFVWVVIMMLRKNDKHIYCYFSYPLAGLLLYSGIFGYFTYTMPQSKNAAAGAKYMTEAIVKLDDEFESITCYQMARERYVKAQFLYPEMDVRIVTSSAALRNLKEKPDILLASNGATAELVIDEARLIGSINSKVLIYACTDEAVRFAEEKGLRVADSGSVYYPAALLPSTVHVIKEGHDENADMDYANTAEDKVRSALSGGAAIYTNYTTIDRAGNYTITVLGENVDEGKITFTCDEGKTALPYETITSEDNKLEIRFKLSKKTEDIRFKLSGVSKDVVYVDSLSIERMGG